MGIEQIIETRRKKLIFQEIVFSQMEKSNSCSISHKATSVKHKEEKILRYILYSIKKTHYRI